MATGTLRIYKQIKFLIYKYNVSKHANAGLYYSIDLSRSTFRSFVF